MQEKIRVMEQKIEELMNKRDAEIEYISAKIEEAKQQEHEALCAMERATENGNVEEYQEAKAAKRNASDALEMYSSRLDSLKNKPLVTKVEYDKNVAQIMSVLNVVSKDAKKRIVEHMEQVRQIAAECGVMLNDGNKVLHCWQHEIYKDKAEQVLANGNRVHLSTLEKEFKDYSVLEFADHALGSTHYRAISQL